MTRFFIHGERAFGFLCGLLLIAVAAAITPSFCLATEPAALKVPLSFESYTCLGPRSLATDRDWWVVYADRENVPVYKDRLGQQLDSSRVLNIREEFWVLDENKQSEMLLLGLSSSHPQDNATPVITETIGWVKWDNLILSFEPIKNENTLISRKAFIINDWRKFKDTDIEDFMESMVVVHAGPSADSTPLGTITGMGQRFSYIYKYESCDKSSPDWYLIGRTKEIVHGRIDDNIVGWIPAARAQPWDTRQALEPVADRPSPAHIYALREELSDSNAAPLIMDPMDRGEWAADRWRYPILEHDEGHEGVLIGWHGALAVEGEGLVKDEKTSAEAAKTYNMMQNVNVVFVMDATTSMKPYLEAVSTAVKNIMAASKKTPYHPNMKIRFGAVVYRDLKDIPTEQIDHCDLNPGHEIAARFLKAAAPPSSGQDTDYEEALFKGIETALIELAQEDQTNILIVVGDAGNDDISHKLSPEIEEQIAVKAPRIIAVHLQRPANNAKEETAINKFGPDMEAIFTLVKNNQDKLYEKMAGAWTEGGGTGEIPKSPATNMFKTQDSEEDIWGAQRSVERALDNILALNGNMMNRLSDILGVGSRSDTDTDTDTENRGNRAGDEIDPYIVDAFTYELLMRQAGSPEAFKLLISNKVQIFQPGWVRLTDHQGRQLMKPMQLVSLTELEATERALNLLFQPGVAPDRTQLLETWQRLVGAVIGDEPRTPEEYMDMVGAILFRDQSCFLTIDFEEIMEMSEERFQEVLQCASAAIERINILRTQSDKLWFLNYSDKFAWIPLEEMP